MTIAANIGDVAILNFKACFPDSIIGFLPFICIDSMFLYYALKSMKHILFSTAVLNTQMNLNIERVSELFIVLPILEEQKKIFEFLDFFAEKIQYAVHKIQTQIQLLQEYRTALISNAVTGKIDVRDEVKECCRMI